MSRIQVTGGLLVIRYIVPAMRSDEPLSLLRQVKDVEILRCRQELAQTEAQLLACRSRSAQQCAAVSALATKIEATRHACSDGLEQRPVSAFVQQSQYRHLQGMISMLRDMNEEKTALHRQIQQMEILTVELQSKLCVLLGQKEGVVGLLKGKEKREALRQERIQEDALSEHWSVRVRP